MKTKLAFVTPNLQGGGAERIMVNIIRHLDPNKFKIRLFLIKKEGPYIKHLPKNLDVINLNSSRVLYSIPKLIKELNNYKPDIIFSTLVHMNIALLLIRSLLTGDPKIFTREANTPTRALNTLPGIKRYFFTFLYKKIYPKSDLIIAQCKEMKSDFLEYLDVETKKIHYIYNPLDVELIREKMLGDNPYIQEKVNFLAVGRLIPQKAFEILLDAFKLVLKEIPNAILTILGEGILENELRQLAKDLDIRENVMFEGFKDNPYPYYYYADTFVLSSRWEGFPNVLLEALACNAKVVATACKSGPKEILGDDEYGILVKVEDADSLAEGMIRSLQEPNKSSNRADDFKVEKIIKEYERIFLL